jgi:hypothetical protein
MNGDARPGLAYIMRELGAQSWREDAEGFVVSVKIGGRRRCRNYLVSANQLEPIERELATDTIPLRVREEDFRRLADTDC